MMQSLMIVAQIQKNQQLRQPQVQLCSICHSEPGQDLCGLLGLLGAFGLPVALCALA